MKKLNYMPIFVTMLFAMLSCQITKLGKAHTTHSNTWVNIGVIEDIATFVDTTSIKQIDGFSFATEKRMYLTDATKQVYVDKIKAVYEQMGKPEKITGWKDFAYCTYECKYDCLNKRFQILSVSDYDSEGRLIAKTQPNKKEIKWLDVDTDTLGDHTIFYICDFGN